ncbi:MAG: hypothetical protein LBS57_03400, partial [Treponema sp.]|nr:hypothetical protein [Treponema sp.]
MGNVCFSKSNKKEWYWKMKGKFGLVLGVMLVFSFVLVACENGNGTESAGNTDPKTIVIEGISVDYTDYGCIRVFSDLNNIVNNQPVNAGIGY